MIEVRDLEVAYGPVQAVRGVSLHVGAGEVVSVIGPNGAGKTSMLSAVSGLVRARSGQVRFFGEEIGHISAPDRARRGIVHVPEGRRLFDRLTVEDNLELGAYMGGRPAKERAAAMREMYEAFPKLQRLRDRSAGYLSGGEQQLVALARGLASRPKLLLLDEPSLGLAPVAIEEVYGALGHQREARPELMILLVEQSATWALELSSRTYSMRGGEIAHEGSSADLMRGNRLVELYLGQTTPDDGAVTSRA